MSYSTAGASYDPTFDWTAPPPETYPEPHPDLWLVPRSSCSFVANDVERLAAWLQYGWRRVPGRSPSEHSRWLQGARLIVLYHTGSVLVQGADIPWTVRMLGQLVRPGGRN